MRLLLGLIGVFYSIGLVFDPARRGPEPRYPRSWRGAPEPLQPLLEGAWLGPKWVLENLTGIGLVIGIPLVLFWIGWIVRHIPRHVPTDPIRMYSPDQRRNGFARAQNRCEFESWWLTRCKKPAQDADHWLPWSKGGATSMDNLVAACARHNRSKGATVPSFWETFRLAWRRRSYFPAGALTQPGQKYR